AFEARERAVAVQEAAMGALGIPSAADVERLTRRVRSVSQRLEGIEDALDRLDDRLAGLDGLGNRLEAMAAGGERQNGEALERRLDEIKADVAALRDAVAPATGPLPASQERLAVTEGAAPARKPRPRRARR
ncbi:MAG TPA: hypothetical protein VGR10_07710, partial [Thermoleophilaceae bacterium]|nr:hypothetical protein [Thermoleophilaceae bacterium]